MFKRAVLEDDKTLSDYDIQAESNMILVKSYAECSSFLADAPQFDEDFGADDDVDEDDNDDDQDSEETPDFGDDFLFWPDSEDDDKGDEDDDDDDVEISHGEDDDDNDVEISHDEDDNGDDNVEPRSEPCADGRWPLGFDNVEPCADSDDGDEDDEGDAAVPPL